MKCNFCGFENDDNAIICASCGEIMESALSTPDESYDADDELIDALLAEPEDTSSVADETASETPADEAVLTDSAVPASKTEETVSVALKATPSNVAKKNTSGSAKTESKIPVAVKEKKDTKKIMIPVIIAVAVVAVAAIIFAVVKSAGSKLTLEDYVVPEITYTGINGYGKVEIDDIDEIIDCDQLDTDLKEGGKSSYNSYYGYYYDYQSVRNYLTVKCVTENNGNLKNGDTVDFLVSIDSEGIKNNEAFNNKLSDGDEYTVTYTVSGLKDGVTINVFDAVSGFIYDSTSSYYNTTIKIKDNFEKTYDNGIKLKTEDGYIRIYGDDFYSFSVGVKTITDNIDKSSTSVKLVLNCEPDEYIENGVVLSPSEQEFTPTIISYVKNDSFSASDRSKLTSMVKSYADDNFNEDNEYTLTKAVFYYDSESEDSRLVYYFKGEESYYCVYTDDLKQYDDGSLVDLDDIYLHYDGYWGNIESIQDYEEDLTYTSHYDIPIE